MPGASNGIGDYQYKLMGANLQHRKTSIRICLKKGLFGAAAILTLCMTNGCSGLMSYAEDPSSLFESQARSGEVWLQLFYQAVARKWVSPEGVGPSAEAKVEIEFDDNGTVRDVRVFGESGYGSFDDSVIRAVIEAEPLPSTKRIQNFPRIARVSISRIKLQVSASDEERSHAKRSPESVEKANEFVVREQDRRESRRIEQVQAEADALAEAKQQEEKKKIEAKNDRAKAEDMVNQLCAAGHPGCSRLRATVNLKYGPKEVDKALEERLEKVAAGELQPSDIAEAGVARKVTIRFDLITSPPLEASSEPIFAGGEVDQFDAGTITAAYFPGSSPFDKFFFKVRTTSATVFFGGKSSLRVGRTFKFVGRHVGNTKITLTNGALKTIAVFQADYIEAE